MTLPILKTILGRLLARNAPKKSRWEVKGGRIDYYQVTAPNGLVISFYPARDRQGPYVIAGCYGRRPTEKERDDLTVAIRVCAGVTAVVCSEARIVNDPKDDRKNWYAVYLDWKEVRMVLN